MQTIKGIIALLLVAVAVFTTVLIYNRKTEARYIARLENKVIASPVKTAKLTAAGMVKTNAVARQNSQNANL